VEKMGQCKLSGGGVRWHSCLRHSATSQKVAGSISYGVTDIIFSAALWP
jgi:hypothetical protein